MDFQNHFSFPFHKGQEPQFGKTVTLTTPFLSVLNLLHIQCDGKLLSWVVWVHVSEHQTNGTVCMMREEHSEVKGRSTPVQSSPSVILNSRPMHFSKSFFCALSLYCTGTCASARGGSNIVSTFSSFSLP